MVAKDMAVSISNFTNNYNVVAAESTAQTTTLDSSASSSNSTDLHSPTAMTQSSSASSSASPTSASATVWSTSTIPALANDATITAPPIVYDTSATSITSTTSDSSLTATTTAPMAAAWTYGGRHDRAGFCNYDERYFHQYYHQQQQYQNSHPQPDGNHAESSSSSMNQYGGGGGGGATSMMAAPSFIPIPQAPHNANDIRRAIRKRMHRCKLCKNRFVEKDIYERHLRDRHPIEYESYMAEQARLMDEQRMAELEQIRREEIATGGFILPASEVEEQQAMADPNEIKLPDEDDMYLLYVDESDGLVKKKRRPFKKKVSPQCPFCDKRFRNDSSLKKHLAKKHPDCIDFVQCNRCFKSVRSAEELPGHACELIHICWECIPIRNMVTAERLDIHRKKFHRGANSGFRCNECNRKFLTPRKLRKHKKMAHVIRKPFKCHFCDEYFPTDTQAALHERIHTGKVKFECNICDYRCNRYVRLSEHKSREHGYLCVICGEKTEEYSELKYHTLEAHAGYLSSEGQAVCIESPRVWVLFKGE